MRIRLGIDVEADEPVRALIADLVTEQPVVQVQIGVVEGGTFNGRLCHATLVPEAEELEAGEPAS